MLWREVEVKLVGEVHKLLLSRACLKLFLLLGGQILEFHVCLLGRILLYQLSYTKFVSLLGNAPSSPSSLRIAYIKP